MNKENFSALPFRNGGVEHSFPQNENSTREKNNDSSHNVSSSFANDVSNGASSSSSNAGLPNSIDSSEPNSSHLSSSDEITAQKDIQVSAKGCVTKIPTGMIKDQFGIVGLLTRIKAESVDDNVYGSLSSRSELESLGLRIGSSTLCTSFGGPLNPCLPQDIDYLVNAHLKNVISAEDRIDRSKEGDLLLFYLFYHFVGDKWQLFAAHKLYHKGWRFHKEEKVIANENSTKFYELFVFFCLTFCVVRFMFAS